MWELGGTLNKIRGNKVGTASQESERWIHAWMGGGMNLEWRMRHGFRKVFSCGEDCLLLVYFYIYTMIIFYCLVMERYLVWCIVIFLLDQQGTPVYLSSYFDCNAVSCDMKRYRYWIYNYITSSQGVVIDWSVCLFILL